MRFRIVTLACVAMLSGAASAQTQQEVKIGVLDPLSGPTAQIGSDAVAAINRAAEIVNEGADLPLALARNKGLPGLGGAKVILVVVDHQGKPEVAKAKPSVSSAKRRSKPSSAPTSPRSLPRQAKPPSA